MAHRQSGRPLELKTPLGVDALLAIGVVGTDGLSRPFEFQVTAYAEDPALDVASLLGKTVELQIQVRDRSTRVLHGHVVQVEHEGIEDQFQRHRLVLRPWFWLLGLSRHSRIFEQMSSVDIFETLAREAGFSGFRLQIDRSRVRKRPYCMQYLESDFDFLSRLFEQDGIYYWFQHAPGSHEMVLGDGSRAAPGAPGFETLKYAARPPESGWPSAANTFTAWHRGGRLQPTTVRLADFDAVGQAAVTSARRSDSARTAHRATVADFPGLPDEPTPDRLAAVATARLGGYTSAAARSTGAGECIALGSGLKFTLAEHPTRACNAEYLVVGTRLALVSNAYRSGAEPEASARIDVEAVDAAQRFWPPTVTPIPRIAGPQTAIVTTSSGDASSADGKPDPDRFGRVKVRFHWLDAEQGAGANRESCWLRVAQAMAGDQWGAQFLPRVGQEVVVAFLDGHPDRPLVVGSVYNAHQMPPFALPDNRTQSGWRTRSEPPSGDTGFNELRFEDKGGEEHVFLHAARDLKVEVENDASSEVRHDETCKVANNRTREVGGDELVEVTKDLALKVGGKRTVEITGDDSLTVTGAFAADVGKTATVTVTDTLTLESTKEIVLKSGGAKITLKASGDVLIEGLNVKLTGNVGVDVKANAQLNLSGGMTKLEGTKLDLNGTAMATLKGGITMIG